MDYKVVVGPNLLTNIFVNNEQWNSSISVHFKVFEFIIK